jgi:holo-[acyl-carrier protein] synthase
MTVLGVGIDVVEISRFEAAIARTPSLLTRLFVPAEAVLNAQSLAARFAAKEALSKALGAPGNLEWHDAEVVSLASGQPTMVLRGTCLARAVELGGTTTHLSLSHDGDIATAILILST